MDTTVLAAQSSHRHAYIHAQRGASILFQKRPFWSEILLRGAHLGTTQNMAAHAPVQVQAEAVLEACTGTAKMLPLSIASGFSLLPAYGNQTP
jgi:hypothetical protein